MDVRRERISRILELKKKLLSIQTGFNVVNAAVICTVLKIISSLEPLTDTTEAQVLEACDSLKLLTVYFDLLVDAAGVVCHQLFLSVEALGPNLLFHENTLLRLSHETILFLSFSFLSGVGAQAPIF